MELMIDDRERGVIKHIEALGATGRHPPGFKYTVKRLTVGDYAFVLNEQVVVIIERKSLHDLASSIQDGRMENNNKLLEAQRVSKCQIIYLIEGPLCNSMERRWGRLPFKCLQGKLDRLMLKYDLHVLWTQDEYHSACRLVGLEKVLTDMHSKGTLREVHGGGKEDEKGVTSVDDVIQCKTVMTTEKVQGRILASFHGISECTSQHLLTQYKLHEILQCNIPKDILAKATRKPAGGCLGKRGLTLYDTCNSIDTNMILAIKMLTYIPGLSKKCASLILSVIPMSTLIASSFELKDVANIKCSSGRNVGMAIAKKITIAFSGCDLNI